MKRYLVMAALVGVLAFSTISLADGRGSYGYGPGPGSGNCWGGRYCDNWSSAGPDDEKAAAFFAETKELRKEIVVKRSELDALMRQDNPDENKVAKLTGELFDLQTTMAEKADKAFDGRPGYGSGPGNCGRRGGW